MNDCCSLISSQQSHFNFQNSTELVCLGLWASSHFSSRRDRRPAPQDATTRSRGPGRASKFARIAPRYWQVLAATVLSQIPEADRPSDPWPRGVLCMYESNECNDILPPPPSSRPSSRSRPPILSRLQPFKTGRRPRDLHSLLFWPLSLLPFSRQLVSERRTPVCGSILLFLSSSPSSCYFCVFLSSIVCSIFSLHLSQCLPTIDGGHRPSSWAPAHRLRATPPPTRSSRHGRLALSRPLPYTPRSNSRPTWALDTLARAPRTSMTRCP